ncbi:EAL domain-containing protein [Burkholderia sp. RF2-non_BP3]|uniref:EAL domain-containing protein n=1 Tax=Burkholderia sp. RF2-non_BP3 TaxID=1637844 RepID=UPI000758FFCB|nr:EAL domain-containing protein [Burkholderia sp. RF2-non_BP3]KUY56802.1 histidine kinase [Burkholderia sp. RF2-non_BP3]
MIKRLTLVSASIVLGCVATIAPVLTSIYVADEDVERRDQNDLRDFAAKALLRAELVTYQAVTALADLERVPGASCSAANLSHAARVIFNYGYVQDAGTYADGQYLCSPLMGDVRALHLTLPPADWRSADGYSVWFRRKSPLSDVREDIQLARNGHYVLIDPKSYVDLIDPARRPIAAVNTDTGTLFALSYGADKDEMLNAWKLGGELENDRWYYAVAKSATGPLAMVVKSPKSSLVGDWPKLLATWLSIGVALGAAIGWLAFKRVSRQLSFPATLEWAISRKKMQVVYQPIVNLVDGRCAGVEALVRWELNGRAVSPEIFVAVAEENHLIQPLTDLVLDKIIADMAPLLRTHPAFYVSINVSSDDLRSDRFLKVLARVLDGTGIDPSQIRIEATERSFMNADETRDVIAAFRAAGHPVYIDDFGTGYSSLSYLQTFQVDILKIDKSFIDTVARDTASSIVAPHIISMAHELGLEVVAEGVESDTQVEYLRGKGVQYGQGWYFAKAMPVVELMAWLLARETSQETARLTAA